MESVPDSQWLVSVVVDAYSDGRYELGLALARLQSQALRMERDRDLLPAVPVTVVGPEVYEPEHSHVQEREQETEPGPLVAAFCGIEGHPDISHVCATMGAPLRYEEAPAPAAEEAPTLVTPSARCIATVGNEGGQAECHGVLYWTEAKAGLPSGWVHLDGGNGGHEPVADRPVNRYQP